MAAILYKRCLPWLYPYNMFFSDQCCVDVIPLSFILLPISQADFNVFKWIKMQQLLRLFSRPLLLCIHWFPCKKFVFVLRWTHDSHTSFFSFMYVSSIFSIYYIQKYCIQVNEFKKMPWVVNLATICLILPWRRQLFLLLEIFLFVMTLLRQRF